MLIDYRVICKKTISGELKVKDQTIRKMAEWRNNDSRYSDDVRMFLADIENL
jgi:hypothetical protein